MATGAESLQLFNQLVALGNSLFLSDEDFVTINGVTKPTLKKIYAEFLASIGTYTTVAAGLAATSGTGTNNRFFSVPGTGDVFETRYRNDAGVAVEISSLLSWLADALTINRGKAYPLRVMNRGGTTSPASTVMNRIILGVRVTGDAQYIDGKYFRVAYLQNEANIGGNVAQGIVLEEFDAATFQATGTATVIHSTLNAPAVYSRTGGVQTFTVIPEQRKNLQFTITIDAAALPAAGTPVNMQTAGSAGYSWIIDQSCYESVRGMGNSIMVNKFRTFPQKSMARNGAVSTPPLGFMAVLLDVEVVGARPGKLYRVAYFKNGVALPGPTDGWIFEEYDAAGYESASNPTLIVVNYTDPAPDIPRSGVQTVVVSSPVVSGLSFKVTLDTASLPALGTQINGNAPGQPGYSYVIDPQRYTMAAGANNSGAKSLQWSYDLAGNLLLAWASKSRCYRIKIGPNGVNQLRNIISVEVSPGSSLAAAVWTVVSITNSDWFPPMQVADEDNGDGAPVNFTGGSHGSNGDGTGDPTARTLLFQPFADHTPIVAGASGVADCVRMQILNELMGYNTVSQGRYIVRQALNVNAYPGCLVLEGCVTALENVRVRVDYGLQLISGGFQGTQLVLGGANTARGPFQLANNNSGPKSTNPSAWAIVLQEDSNGQLALWMDTSYEAGDGRHVVSTEPLLRGSTFGKWYLGAVLSPTAGIPFAKGAGYKYRAGLSWQSPGMQPAAIDSVIEMTKSSQPTYAYGLPNGEFVKVS